MSKKNKIYLILFSVVFFTILFGFIWSFIVTRDIRNPKHNESVKNQSVSVNNLVLTETKDDKIYWELYAEKGTYESKDATVILTNPTGNFYNEQNEVVMSFKSDFGYYFEEKKIIVLKGNTYVVANEGSSIRANEITIKGKDEDIVASGNVIFQKDQDFITNSKKARFNTDLTFFEISGNSETKVFSKKDKEENKEKTKFLTK